MKLGLRRSATGVPTTPRPRNPAPNPRYNDLTRPRSLQCNEDGQQQQVHFWNDSAGGERKQKQLSGSYTPEINPKPCWSASGSGAACEPFVEKQRQPLPPSDLDHPPPPWQGKIDLPESDEEIMNAAQTWIAQILHENYEDGHDDDIDLSSAVLVDGRALCRVANAIASGSVETIHQDKAKNATNMRSFLTACQKFGVPAGALFDLNDPDPRQVGLCLHVLSRVVRDTVPEFVGPFLLARSGSSHSWSLNTSSNDRNDGGEAPNINNNELPFSEGVGPTGSKLSQQWLSVNSDEEQHQQYPQPQRTEERQRKPRPPTPPPADRPRPLSFPSRFSPSSPADDTMWSSLFPSPASLHPLGGNAAAALAVGGGGEGVEGGVVARGGGEAAAAAMPWHAAVESQVAPQGQVGSEFSSPSRGSLSSWLSDLNLGTFEGALVNIGVEIMGDLQYVEEQDLREIGMHGPQIRKLLLNRP